MPLNSDIKNYYNLAKQTVIERAAIPNMKTKYISNMLPIILILKKKEQSQTIQIAKHVAQLITNKTEIDNCLIFYFATSNKAMEASQVFHFIWQTYIY